MNSNAKKSPLTSPPLRNPGQSVDEEIHRILADEVSKYLIISLGFIGFAFYEWYRSFFGVAPQPVAITLAAVVVSAYALFRLIPLRRHIRNLKLGRDGEKAVGQYLEELRQQGCRIFHDIIGDGFNIDHVILSRHGIYTVETKTHRKPKNGPANIEVKSDYILVNGMQPDRNANTQALAQSRWLRDTLKESTGRTFSVRPVVVYPGWFVQPAKSPRTSPVWVLNPKALPSFILNEPASLSEEDLKLASYHLSRYIRTS